LEPWFWLIYLGVGLFVGFLTGLLGIGGGTVIVPILSLIFAAKGFPPDHVIHMALGTSLASIIIGSFASAREHHLHHAVDWTLVKRLAPGIVFGTLSGAVFAHFVAVAFLKAFFVGLVCFIAFQMLFGVKAKPLRKTLPGTAGIVAFGYFMGFVSSLAGIGGAVLTISFLMMCSVGMHQAIGTAAAVGIPIALAGTVGFIITGLMDANLPPGSLGYVYLPAWFGISVASWFIAPYGARLAHRIPVDVMKKVFMVFIVALAIKMAVSV
jgi:uncharacterized protein